VAKHADALRLMGRPGPLRPGGGGLLKNGGGSVEPRSHALLGRKIFSQERYVSSQGTGGGRSPHSWNLPPFQVMPQGVSILEIAAKPQRGGIADYLGQDRRWPRWTPRSGTGRWERGWSPSSPASMRRLGAKSRMDERRRGAHGLQGEGHGAQRGMEGKGREIDE